MRVGIIGDNERTTVWERHLRPLESVREVILASDLSELDNTRVCLLIDDSPHCLERLSDAIRMGIHTFLISELPTDAQALRRVHSLAQESGVCVQFSHWPTLSPATQWMRGQLPKPRFLQVLREAPQHTLSENRDKFSKQWIDEIAWIVKWAGADVHRVEADEPLPDLSEFGVRVHLNFENGAAGSLLYLTASSVERHRRMASHKHLFLDLDLRSLVTRQMDVKEDGSVRTSRRSFDASESAAISAMLFFKAVRLRQTTAYTPYDALQNAKVVGKIRELLNRG